MKEKCLVVERMEIKLLVLIIKSMSFSNNVCDFYLKLNFITVGVEM